MPPSTRGSALKDSSVLEAPHVGALKPPRARSRLALVRPLLQPKILIGGVIVFILVIAGALAPWIAPYDPNAQNLALALRPPQWFFGAHALGTDAVGRDILSRLFYGARISLVIAVMVVLISGVVGIGLGAVSGYFAGAVDFLIQKLVEVIWAFPPLLLAIPCMAFRGRGPNTLTLAVVMQRCFSYGRAARGQAFSLRSREFVEGARVWGASNVRIIPRHIMPNLFQSAVVIGTFAM